MARGCLVSTRSINLQWTAVKHCTCECTRSRSGLWLVNLISVSWTNLACGWVGAVNQQSLDWPASWFYCHRQFVLLLCCAVLWRCFSQGLASGVGGRGTLHTDLEIMTTGWFSFSWGELICFTSPLNLFSSPFTSISLFSTFFHWSLFKQILVLFPFPPSLHSSLIPCLMTHSGIVFSQSLGNVCKYRSKALPT